jgi:hypothetical protein
MVVINTLACYDTATITAIKGFIVMNLGSLKADLGLNYIFSSSIVCKLEKFVLESEFTTPVACTIKLLRS